MTPRRIFVALELLFAAGIVLWAFVGTAADVERCVVALVMLAVGWWLRGAER